MVHHFTILGIESSCDETALAVLQGHPETGVRIIAETLYSQIEQHKDFGGVVPEIAARAHLDRIADLLNQTMRQAGVGYADLDAVAATAGPGLIGGVIVGLTVAKGICLGSGLPLIGINHLEGHALMPRAFGKVEFPYLLLLVSGGHCQILIVYGVGRYECLGQTLDDAAGEAFDKIAKFLKVGFPGGQAVEKLAKTGNPNAFSLPRPLCDRPQPDFSFSGLKTAVMRLSETLDLGNIQVKADLCASFQGAVTDCLTRQMQKAIAIFKQKTGLKTASLVVSGGVAANKTIRMALEGLCDRENMTFTAPPSSYCTDNGVMIAYAGLERLALGYTDRLDIAPKARWELQSLEGA